MGLRIGVNKMMQIAVPLVFGGIGTVFGAAPVFWATSGLLLLGGLASTVDRTAR